LGLLIWAAVLLVWTGPLIDNEDREEREPPSVRLFVVLLDQLAREFLLRKDAQEQDDPLAGLWLPLEAAIAAPFRLEFEAPTPRDQLLTTLLSSLPAPAAGDRPWIARLRHILNAPNAQPAKLQQSTAKIRPEWSPASLDQVYGNAVVLRDLRARFESKRHTKPLLLHGAKGIGKRTIARVYARTLLCESRDEESWLACSRCTACRSFDASGNIGLMEFDPANDQTGDIAKEVLSKLSFGLYHRHRIVIIENPERSARAVDTLLKTLEDGVAQTTFVLCVSDLSAISVTGQSRCTHHRVRPLGAVESTALANGMINRLGTKAPDPEAIRLIVAVAEGLPGKLQRICNIVAAAKALSLEDVTRALDLDWIGFILSYWVALVCLQRPASGALTLPPNVDPEKAVQQVRQVLSVLHRTKQLTDTIEVLLTEELGQQRDKIVQLLTERAAELVVPYDELWSRLARHWTSSDHADARAFLQAGLVSRQIIHGSMVDSH
jgi:DNA polymerase III delta prime subunit